MRLKKSGVVIAEVNVNFGEGVNRDWSGVSADTDTILGKSVVSGLETAPGAANTHILYIPRPAGHTKVRICPSATSLGAVTTSCASGVEFTEGQTQAVGADTVTVTATTINTQQYWIASGLSGTGGISIQGFFSVSDTMTRLQISEESNHTIQFGTINGLSASGDTISLTFDPVGQSFNLGSITLSDIDLEDDGTDVTLGAAAGVNTWGVSINNTNDVITFTAPTSGSGYIGGGSVIVIKIGTNTDGPGTNQIVNPASLGSY